MDIAQWFYSQWTVIANAPATFIVAIVIAAATTAKIMHTFFGTEAAAAKLRVEHYQELLKAKEQANDSMGQQLKALGEAVAVLKSELAERPRIFIQKEEPKDTRHGDIWVQE